MKTIQVQDRSTPLPVGKILCLGRNYAEHAKEMNSKIPTKPIVFLKPASSIVCNGEDIIKPAYSNDMHHEVELVLVIGRGGQFIPEKNAKQHILGYGIGLDMTLRDVQKEAKTQGLPWFTAKGFHTSAAISEIVPAEKVPDPASLEIRCTVNGTVRQFTNTNQMIFSIEKTVAYLSTVVALEEGDLIYTGTPEGVGSVFDGDIIEAELVGFVRTSHHIRFTTA